MAKKQYEVYPGQILVYGCLNIKCKEKTNILVQHHVGSPVPKEITCPHCLNQIAEYKYRTTFNKGDTLEQVHGTGYVESITALWNAWLHELNKLGIRLGFFQFRKYKKKINSLIFDPKKSKLVFITKEEYNDLYGVPLK